MDVVQQLGREQFPEESFADRNGSERPITTVE